MKITDGKQTVDITLRTWQDGDWTPDWSEDFYDAGALNYDEEHDIYHVEDVAYCVEQANDWVNYQGDWDDPDTKESDAARGIERCAEVVDLD